MTKAETTIVGQRITRWPAADRAWWANLLENRPGEALIVAGLVLLLDIRPTDDAIVAAHEAGSGTLG